MKNTLNVVKGVVLLSCLGLLMGRATIVHGQRRATTNTTYAVQQFTYSLSKEQKAQAMFALTDQQRFDWHFVPRARKGLALKDLSMPQVTLLENMLKSILSEKGFAQNRRVRNDLEAVLQELEGPKRPFPRDPELYYVSIFGTPGDRAGWTWRFEGHHISLNFTIAGGMLRATTPDFLGASPAEVMSGPNKGFRALAAEEDKGFELLHALDDQQKQKAVLQGRAPNDILTSNSRTAQLQSPAGLPAASMTDAQQKILRGLINEYASRMVEDVADARLARMEEAGFDKVAFAWIGADALHEPHYYRVQGPTFLIEFDNVEDNANHIHSVWRDFNRDFGADLLKENPDGVPHVH
jgi:hypothetical protein